MPAAPKFRLTIIHESAEAGERAKRLGDQLIAEAGVGEAFERNQWSFGVLGIPEVRNAAASAAAVADAVIISMSGTAALPLAGGGSQWNSRALLPISKAHSRLNNPSYE